MSILQNWWIWLVIIAVTFAIHEAWAGLSGHQMLTDYVRTETLRFPILIFFLGMAVGWASAHFWGDRGIGQ